MSRISPTLEGFRVAFRRPSLTLAEISWRWTVGAAATAVFLFSLLEFLDTLPVTRGDILLLRTRQPILIGQALGHIFRGSFPRLVVALLLAAVALTFLWIVAASVGRMTTVRSLIDYFAERQKSMTDRLQNDDPEVRGHKEERGYEEGAENYAPESISLSNAGAAPQKNSRPLGSLLRLNFLRAAVALAAILGFVGVLILVQMVAASLVSKNTATDVAANGSVPPPNPGAGLAFLLFFPLTGLVLLTWSTLNWVLSLAGMFAVSRDGGTPQDARSALSAAVTFCRERIGPVFAVSTWTGLAHLTLFVVATTAVSIPLSFAPIVPRRVVLIAVFLVAVAYFAVADWFYVVRLAGYVCIAELPEALLAPQFPPATPAPPNAFPHIQTTIDRDEPILSDMPNLAVET